MHLHLHLNAPTLISIYFLWKCLILYDFEYSLPGIVQQVERIVISCFWPSKKAKASSFGDQENHHLDRKIDEREIIIYITYILESFQNSLYIIYFLYF